MKNIIIGNWKMNLLAPQASNLAAGLAELTRNLKNSQVWIAPALTALPEAAAACSGSALRVGAQNVHWSENGAFTGEVSVSMLKEKGASFAIIGHSERRHVFGESSELCARRARAAAPGFSIVFCVGETEEERSSGKTTAVIKAQLEPLLRELSPQQAQEILVAYEPVWAIGTGKVAQPPQIRETHSDIQRIWKELSASACPPILYGGSVTPDNFKSIIEIEEVQGALVGGASLVYDKFEKIVRIAEG